MQIDHIYIINLRSSVESIVDRLNELQMPSGVPYTIINGINGRNLVTGKTQLDWEWSAAEWWKIEGHTNEWWSRDINAAEIGCTLSHTIAWNQAILDKSKNALILEEDFNTKGNGWPAQEIWDQIPSDYDLFYVGRRRVPGYEDIPYSKDIVISNYVYNSHAYVISATGIKKALAVNPSIDIIPMDELIPGLAHIHPRPEVNERFKADNFSIYAFNCPNLHYVTQTTIMQNSISEDFPILNTSNWEAWTQRYVAPVMLQRDYELMTDNLGPNIIEFPLFTDTFCEELIQLAESKGEWTMGRHEFYPTNDMLMETLGMKDIYTRVIREYVAPLATWYYTLEGQGWDVVEDETFIIRYRPDRQGQLSVHHDYSSYTIGVKLNDEFEGGGTYFPKYGVNAIPKRNGNAFMHPGMITHRHGGRPVYSGTRYIAVSFIKNTSILK